MLSLSQYPAHRGRPNPQAPASGVASFYSNAHHSTFSHFPLLRLPASIFHATLTRDATAGYATEHVHCLTDAQATSKSIRQAFADISAEAGAGCSVLVVMDMPTVEIQGGPEAGFYFCPHDYRWQPAHLIASPDTHACCDPRYSLMQSHRATATLIAAVLVFTPTKS